MSNHESDLAPNLAQNPQTPPQIPTHIMAGSTPVPADQVATLSIAHARALCEADDSAFIRFIDQIAIGAAIFYGSPIPDSEEAFHAIRQTVLFAEQIDDDSRIGEVIAYSMQGSGQYEPLPTATIAAWNQSRKGASTSTLCHAPTTNLYFGRDGYVGACCYSRGKPMGRIPENTIAEIWSSRKANAMRKQLGKAILPAGCEICAEQVLAHNFEGFLAANFESLAPPETTSVPPVPTAPRFPRRFSFLSFFNAKPTAPPAVSTTDNTIAVSQYPRQMEFELSNKCNLECAMCNGFFSSSIRANRENKPPLPMIYDAAFVQQLREFIPHLTSAKFLGGEPFLIDIYYDIWDIILELNPTCELTITTNAAVLTAKALRIIEKLNCQIVVSFDSISKPTYESIRVNATFEKTLENLEKIVAINLRKGKPLCIAVCPMVSNCDEIPAIIAFANQRQISVYFNTVTRPAELSIKFLPVSRQQQLVAAYRTSLTPAETPLEANNWRALTDLANQIEAWSLLEERVRDEGLVILT